MDCGLVLERIIGGIDGGGGGVEGGGGRVWRHQKRFPSPQQQQEEEGEEDYYRHLHHYAGVDSNAKKGRELITSVLAVFQLDNQHVSERVMENYDKVYGRRRTRLGFRKNEFKQRVACAFSICNTLARLQMPRPPEYVARLCEVPCKSLLNLPAYLSLEHEELTQLHPEDYELEEGQPQDYIDVVCSNLGISFNTAGEARRVAENARWILHGRHPTVIAAASLQVALTERGELERERAIAICDLFDCRQRTVDAAAKILRQQHACY
jgi:hypothetical protein